MSQHPCGCRSGEMARLNFELCADLPLRVRRRFIGWVCTPLSGTIVRAGLSGSPFHIGCGYYDWIAWDDRGVLGWHSEDSSVGDRPITIQVGKRGIIIESIF